MYTQRYLMQARVLKSALEKALKITSGDLLHFGVDSRLAVINLPIVGELTLATNSDVWAFSNVAYNIRNLRDLAPRYYIELHEYAAGGDADTSLLTLDTGHGLFLRKNIPEIRRFVTSGEINILSQAIQWAQDNNLEVMSQPWEGIEADYTFRSPDGGILISKFSL